MKTRLSHKLIITAVLSTFALSACGIRGELKTPPPLWGDKDKQVVKQDQDDSQTDEQKEGNGNKP